MSARGDTVVAYAHHRWGGASSARVTVLVQARASGAGWSRPVQVGKPFAIDHVHLGLSDTGRCALTWVAEFQTFEKVRAATGRCFTTGD